MSVPQMEFYPTGQKNLDLLVAQCSSQHNLYFLPINQNKPQDRLSKSICKQKHAKNHIITVESRNCSFFACQRPNYKVNPNVFLIVNLALTLRKVPFLC